MRKCKTKKAKMSKNSSAPKHPPTAFFVFMFLTTLLVAPLASFTRLGLYYLAFPMLEKCTEIGLPELILMVIISQYLTPYVKSKRPISDRFAVLFSVAIVWVYAGILTWSDGAHKKSMDTLTSCRTDCAGLVIGAPCAQQIVGGSEHTTACLADFLAGITWQYHQRS